MVSTPIVLIYRCIAPRNQKCSRRVHHELPLLLAQMSTAGPHDILHLQSLPSKTSSRTLIAQIGRGQTTDPFTVATLLAVILVVGQFLCGPCQRARRKHVAIAALSRVRT